MSRKPVQGLLDLLKYRLDGASLVKVVMWVTITGQAGEQNGNFRLPGYLLPKSRKRENEEKKKNVCSNSKEVICLGNDLSALLMIKDEVCRWAVIREM